MSLTRQHNLPSSFAGYLTAGVFWLVFGIVSAVFFFHEGFDALIAAWQLPEYSHGPLIPALSLFLFLRQLKTVPINLAPVTDRAPGVALLLFALTVGVLGKLSQINEVVAYAIILWIGALLLISWGWQQGKHFWPPVLHLVYMLPLPGVIYYKASTSLQVFSSESASGCCS